jgi:putative membrane protein
LLIPIGVGIISIALTGTEANSGEAFTSFPAWRFAAYFPLGIAVSLTQIVPGLSATAILMALGQFGPILNSVSFTYIKENPEVLGLYASMILGFAVGIVLISKIFSIILVHHKITAFFMICGMSVGSVVSMFINPDMYAVYCSWGSGKSPAIPIAVGSCLMIVGFIMSFILTRHENKHSDN